MSISTALIEAALAEFGFKYGGNTVLQGVAASISLVEHAHELKRTSQEKKEHLQSPLQQAMSYYQEVESNNKQLINHLPSEEQEHFNKRLFSRSFDMLANEKVNARCARGFFSGSYLSSTAGLLVNLARIGFVANDLHHYIQDDESNDTINSNLYFTLKMINYLCFATAFIADRFASKKALSTERQAHKIKAQTRQLLIDTIELLQERGIINDEQYFDLVKYAANHDWDVTVFDKLQELYPYREEAVIEIQDSEGQDDDCAVDKLTIEIPNSPAEEVESPQGKTSPYEAKTMDSPASMTP